MAQVLEEDEVIDPLLSAAEESLRKLRWPTATASRMTPVGSCNGSGSCRRDHEEPAGLDEAERAGVGSARCLRSRLQALRDRYPQTGALALTGHAHLDLAWLWPLAETRRKAIRTFSSVIGLMERHPGFRFNQSTAQLYAFLEADDPALFQQIKQKVASGQWEPIGGMWVEPDTNMPTGALVRQLLYGQRYSSEPAAAIRSAGCRLLRLLAGASADPAPRRYRQLLHDQGQLVRDQRDALRPLLVGGSRRQPGACAHLQESGRRLQQ